ncbi:LysR family transcriptional regulator [Biostraticola tofi]|uniref:DNA-binding transcriptional LysR family regulator n=1 Tax=Biostraticola tofi TaxID=466109 RepID=A0A4R3YZJ6_9GAMM|nr:LysR family transcriptional regulator [Biostraticola tofi]TCV96833.1 DNA-binding transcriptional LysR family regulator [Biostraticola tofi]
MNAENRVATDRARELAVFAAVVQHGSFSHAGRVLNLSASAISRTLDRIEARLGVRLLLRTTRSLSLTAEGQAYLQAARRILKDLDDSEQQIADQGFPRGRLRVSASLSHGQLHIVPLLPEFAALYPHILVDISLTDTITDIAGGQADIAVRFGKLPDSSLTARKLGEEKRVVAASPDYLARWGTPTRPAELLSHNCLHFNFHRTETSWPFRVNGTVEWLPIKGSIEANSGQTLRQLAMLGMGIVRLGEFLVGADILAGRLVPILQDFNPGDAEEVNAVFVGGSNTPARVRAFVDFLAERLSQRMQ